MQDKIDEARGSRSFEIHLPNYIVVGHLLSRFKFKTVTVSVLCIKTNPTCAAGFWLVTELIHLWPGFCLPLRSIRELVIEERDRESAGAQGCAEAACRTRRCAADTIA